MCMRAAAGGAAKEMNADDASLALFPQREGEVRTRGRRAGRWSLYQYAHKDTFCTRATVDVSPYSLSRKHTDAQRV